MNKLVLSAAICLASAVFASAGYAADPRGMDEAKEHGCLKCHDVDKKKVGPSYKDISAKLKGKTADEGVAAVKAKPVHKSVVQKATDSSLKEIMTWVQSL